ncbi:GNAT family N-acetyltransferase [Deinococcus irradiatisoli]|nr:GNAT family N-acetyltransferase [Deinococcus irradiatisoli]
MTRLQRIETANAAVLKRYAAAGGAALDHFGPLDGLYAGPDLPVNVAFGESWQAGAGAALPQVEAFCAAHGFPAGLLLHSHAHPALLSALSERGYRLSYVLHAYVHALSGELPMPRFPAEEVTPATWAEQTPLVFGAGSEAIMKRNAEKPNTRCLGVKRAGSWVGFGAMSLETGEWGRAALLYSAGTLPQARGQGIQTALLAARLRLARDSGANFAAVYASPGSVSERNVVRAGFELVGARLNFVQS